MFLSKTEQRGRQCWDNVVVFLKFHLLIKGLQTKEELKIAHMYLKEHQETIDELRRSISEKTAQIISIQQDLEKSKTELQEKVCVFFLSSFDTSFLPFSFKEKISSK